MKEPKEIEVRFIHALMPILFLSIFIGYGLIARPLFFEQVAFPLEVVFLIASMFSIGQLLIMGFEWHRILKAIVKKLSRRLPAVLILFVIGVIIGS